MHNKGYTLLELIIALVVITIVMTPLVSLFITQGTADYQTRQYNRALFAATDYLDRLSAIPFGQVNLISCRPVTINASDMRGEATVAFVDPCSLERVTMPTHVKAATVTVSWKDHAATESITLSRVLEE